MSCLTSCLKLNCDAAVKRSSGALGCIICNSLGYVVECFGKQISVSSVFLAEALAIREACLFCANAGIGNAFIGSDNSSVVN